MQEDPKEHPPDIPSPKSMDDFLLFVKREHEIFLSNFKDIDPARPLSLDDIPALKTLLGSHQQRLARRRKVIDAFRVNLQNDHVEALPQEDYDKRSIILNVLDLEAAHIDALHTRVNELRERFFRREKEGAIQLLRRLLELKAARSEQSPPHPPLNAQFLLYLVLEKKGREEAVGDALEKYSGHLAKFGKWGANFLFYQEIGRCVWPCVKRVAVKTGVLILLSEALRRLFAGESAALLIIREWVRKLFS